MVPSEYPFITRSGGDQVCKRLRIRFDETTSHNGEDQFPEQTMTAIVPSIAPNDNAPTSPT
jgi:hypothetical protein